MLLTGGYGDEAPRFFSSLPLDGRLRPALRHARQRLADRGFEQLAALQHRADRRGPLPDHHGGRRLRAEEINIVAQGNALLVTGQKKPDEEGVQYLHRGIAARAFKQSFDLADHVKVVGAGLENGLLTIELAREIPEAMKPRRIDIRSTDGAKTVEHAKAA
jgi:hypothetical protein